MRLHAGDYGEKYTRVVYLVMQQTKQSTVMIREFLCLAGSKQNTIKTIVLTGIQNIS